MSSHLAANYTKSIKRYPYRHAFYEPELFDALYPSIYGYLNELGQQQPITEDLNNLEALKLEGFSVSSTLDKALPRKHKQGPKISNAITYTKTSLKARVSLVPTSIPVDVSVLFNYQSLIDFGAILVYPETVIQEGFYYQELFRKQVFDNTTTILKAKPDAKTNSFWVVTTTNFTIDVQTNTRTSKDTQVSITFKVDIVSTSEIVPSGEFYRVDLASGQNYTLLEV